MESSVVHLAVISDCHFFVPTFVMLMSARETMQPGSRYHVHFFHRDLKPYQLDALKQLESPSLTISLQELAASHWDKFSRVGEFPPIVLARLELPLLLSELERVLYLDGDIIVHRDLSALYNTDLGGNLLAAVREIALAHSDYPQKSGIAESINSGVLVMNLDLMRRENCVQRFLQTKVEAPPNWLYPDQDVLSVCCEGRILFLPPRCNGMMLHYRAAARAGMGEFNRFFGTAYPSLEELEADFLLTHLAGTQGQRPWESTHSVCKELWEFYFRSSPLRHMELKRNPIPRRNEESTYCLFGFFPLLTIRRKYLPQSDTLKLRVLLFGCLPVISAKGNKRTVTWKLFSCIPLWKQQTRERD